MSIKKGDKVYITKWWKSGIIIGIVEDIHEILKIIYIKNLQGGFISGQDVFASQAEARKNVETQRRQEIESLQKKILKMEEFSPKFKDLTI